MIYAALLVCAVAATVLVWQYDMYEKEPWWMIGIAIAGGAVVMWNLSWIENITIQWISPGEYSVPVISFVAATHEELGKLLVVVAIALLARKQFNDPMDGIIYGSMAGLGAALEESFGVLLALPDVDWAAARPELVRYAGHLVMGGIGGFSVGMAVTKKRSWPFVLAGCLCISMLIHFLWDCIALTVRGRDEMGPRLSLASTGLMLAGMLVYGVLVTIGSRWSRETFDPGSKRRLWTR